MSIALSPNWKPALKFFLTVWKFSGFLFLAIKPTSGTVGDLEAETREQLLKEADEATYTRQNVSVEQERSIKENELRTEQAVQDKRQELESSDTAHQIKQEERRKDLGALESANSRIQSDASAYGLEAIVKALKETDPKIIQAMASTGMKP